MDDRCPYCKQVLDRTPRRKVPCQHCGNPIYVRTKQELFPTSLLTNEQVAAWELFAKMSAGCYPEDPARSSQLYTPVTIGEYNATRARLAVALRREPYATEVVWHLAKRAAAQEAISDSGSVMMVYQYMAVMLNKIGQDHIPVQRKYYERVLTWHKSQNCFRTATVMVFNGACEACKQQDRKALSIEEALRTMPLPCIGCTTEQYDAAKGLCRCLYSFRYGQ